MGQLQPNLITERLVVAVLGAHRELIPRLFAGLGGARAVRALTILGRAALTNPPPWPRSGRPKRILAPPGPSDRRHHGNQSGAGAPHHECARGRTLVRPRH